MGRIGTGTSGETSIVQRFLPTEGNNPSFTLTYTDGDLTAIVKTVDNNDYRKTLTYTDGDLTGITTWIAL